MNDDTRILVSQLDGTSAWDALQEHLNAHRVSLINQLLGGYLERDEYHRKCGEIMGLDAILTAPGTPDPKRPASRTMTPTRH